MTRNNYSHTWKECFLDKDPETEPGFVNSMNPFLIKIYKALWDKFCFMFVLALFSFLYFLSKTFLKLFDNFSIFIYRSGRGSKMRPFHSCLSLKSKGLNITALNTRGQSHEDPNMGGLREWKSHGALLVGTCFSPSSTAQFTEGI